MATLREIRTRIASVKSTQQITKAMKMVAAAKLRKAQEKIIATRPYAMKLHDLVSDLVSRVDPETNSFLQERPLKRILLVVVTADRGLCGAFNANLIREAELKIKSYKEVEVFVYPIGRKGAEFFRKRNYTIFDQ